MRIVSVAASLMFAAGTVFGTVCAADEVSGGKRPLFADEVSGGKRPLLADEVSGGKRPLFV